MFPKVWVEIWSPGLIINPAPLMTGLKPGTVPIVLKQYPMSWETHLGIQSNIFRQKQAGIFIDC